MIACLNAIFNGGAALFAALAALAWFKAASAPLPWSSSGGEGDSDTAPADELRVSSDANKGALRGAVWNRRAAICAGLSAAMQTVALIAAGWH